MKYDISNEEFNNILLEILSEMPANQLISVPGIYEILAEEFNNEILQKWSQRKESND